MHRHRIWIAAIGMIVSAAPAVAQQQPIGRPCAAIRAVCAQAGFVPQGARAGEGLVVDCIRPIMMGVPQPPRAVKPLPAVDPQLVDFRVVIVKPFVDEPSGRHPLVLDD